jgi:hypothetical protein
MRLIPVKVFVFVVCVNLFHKCALASNTDTTSGEESVVDNFVSGLKVVYRAYEQCESVRFGDLLTCLKLRALKFADRVLRSDFLRVIDGINIVKSIPNPADRNGRRINLEPLTEFNENVLPTDPEQKEDKLNEMLVQRLARFFQTHSVQFDMPRFMEESTQLLEDYTVEEGTFLVLFTYYSSDYIMLQGFMAVRIEVVRTTNVSEGQGTCLFFQGRSEGSQQK